VSEIKIIIESAGQSNLKDALADLREYKDLTEAIKSNKESLIKAQDIGNIQKVTAELKKAEVQLDALKKKSIEQTDKENKKLAEQSGLIGQLLTKKKQLQSGILSAKTVDEVKKLNAEMFKVNAQLQNIKDSGKKTFDNLSNLLNSFQFKFNFFANVAAGAVGILTQIGTEGAKALYEGAKASGIFGESIKNTKINTEALQGALDAVEKQLGRIGKTQGEIIADALGLGLEARRSSLEQALRDANRTATAGLSDEDKQKVIDQRQGIIDQLAALDAEEALKIEDAKKEAVKNQVDIAKDGADRELLILKESLQQQIRLIKTAQDRSGSTEARLSRISALEASIADVDKELAKRQKERDEKLAKEREENAKKVLAEKEKSLQKEFKAFTDYWDRLDKADRDRERERLKQELDDMAKAAEERIKKAQELQKQSDEEDKESIQAFNDAADREREKRAKALEKARLKELEREKEIAELVGMAFEKQIEKRIALNEKQISNQEKAIETQRNLAERGLENTLAFEEKRKAELEEREREEQKRLERIKKLEAYFNLFANYAKDPETKNRAALLAARDILLAESLSQAFAQDGGVVEDIAQPFAGGTIKDGIFVGRTHKQGGIHLEAEGEEGIFSKKEMANLGKENFYAIKDLLKNPINDDEFQRQESSFMQVVPIRARGDSMLASAVDRLSQKFDNIPQIHQGIDNLDRIVETRIESGLKRTILRPKRQI
jgi:hypothetical protein